MVKPLKEVMSECHQAVIETIAIINQFPSTAPTLDEENG
jgi:hypothetical protein